MSDLKVSVLISVYKKEKKEYFCQAIDSILNQSYAPDEILLIQDGPLGSELEEAINSYMAKYPNFRVYKFERNQQLGRALKKGVELCKYELIARMDTDDICVKDRLKFQKEVMEDNPHISVCGGWIREFNDDKTYTSLKKMPEESHEILRYGKYRCPVNHMTVMFRKSAVLECGNYVHFPGLEDYHLWSRMLAKGCSFYNIQKVLVNARANGDIYGRRGGTEYFKRFLKLRRLQKEKGLINFFEHKFSVLFTATMTLSPEPVRAFLYKKVLRRGR